MEWTFQFHKSPTSLPPDFPEWISERAPADGGRPGRVLVRCSEHAREGPDQLRHHRSRYVELVLIRLGLDEDFILVSPQAQVIRGIFFLLPN